MTDATDQFERERRALADGWDSLGLEPGPSVLRRLPASVRAVDSLGDAAEPLIAHGAAVPGGLAEGAEKRPDLAAVHAESLHICGTVSNRVLDTVAYLCYNGSRRLTKGDTR